MVSSLEEVAPGPEAAPAPEAGALPATGAGGRAEHTAEDETTDRIKKPVRTGPKPRLSGRALWAAFAAGVVASVLLLGGLVAWAVVDDSQAPRLRRTAFAVQRHGTLWVDAREVEVARNAGSVQAGDVRLDFSRTGSALDLRVQGPPGSVVLVDGISRGPSPIAGLKIGPQDTVLEVRKPCEGSGRPLRLRYRAE